MSKVTLPGYAELLLTLFSVKASSCKLLDGKIY
jgi:hypothetical protein